MTAYLELANAVTKAAEDLATLATELLRVSQYEQSFRDRILAGLALKIDSSFRALVDDAAAGRGEAMHHLKTMVESFIYFHVVAKDATDATARRVFAKALDEKRKFLQDCDPPDIVGAAEVEKGRDAMLRGLTPLPSIKRLAKDHGPALGSWYSHVYRLACEPAHVGDLNEFMPGADQMIQVGPSLLAERRAIIALDRGLETMVGMMSAIDEMNEIGLRATTEPFNARLTAIREAP
jgi:hypothetical protein